MAKVAESKKEEKSNDVPFPHTGEAYFKSDEYLKQIPNDPKWILSDINVDPSLINKPYNSKEKDNFVPLDKEKPHRYYKVVEEALKTYREFDEWTLHEDGDKNKKGWKLMKDVKDEKDDKKSVMKTYWNKIQGSDISAVMGVMPDVPYSVSVFIGMLLSDEQLQRVSPDTVKRAQLEQLNEYAFIYYSEGKKPMAFVAPRAFLVVCAFYPLGNGEVLYIKKSIKSHEKCPENKDVVIGLNRVSCWHLRPCYETGKLNHTHATWMGHFDPCGSIPQFIVDQKIGDAATIPLKFKKLIDVSLKDLHKPGQLSIPYDMMMQMKVFNDKNKNNENDKQPLSDDNKQNDDDN